ncbi:MAG: hypothetical protein QW331_01975 [Candidatus Woesearchaeota archaeon]
MRCRWTENPDDGFRQTLFQAYVREETTGKEKWMPLSVNKCFRQVTLESELKAAMRYYLNHRIIPVFYARERIQCSAEGCGATNNLEFHHEKPTFDQIFREAYSKLSKAEIDWWLGFNFFEEERFMPPENCPAMKLFIDWHKPDYYPPLSYRWVCKSHHKEISASQKRKKPLEEIIK